MSRRPPTSPEKSPESASRASHAALDRSTREKKAIKISKLLPPEHLSAGAQLLEIGTGSGWIGQYFASRGLQVSAVDIRDERQVAAGVDFRLVQDTTLPFPDDCFDVVLSNHVLEHVGPIAAQILHLHEIARVLAPGGIAYLASPSRWMLVEPHFRLAFLSWLPAPLRSTYVRLRRRGAWYDCNPLSLGQIRALIAHSGLHAEDITLPAARAFYRDERPGSLTSRILAIAPTGLLTPLRSLAPTHVYLLRP